MTRGADTAASTPGTVIISPAVPSETPKLDPIDVSRPMGRISVVTTEKMPVVTERTASQEMSGERPWGASGSAVVRALVVLVDMDPVLRCAASDDRRDKSSASAGDCPAGIRRQRAGHHGHLVTTVRAAATHTEG
ncbi:hypothetical protein [Streptomyces niveus]|uniref:hypothetical protein n=1 Tax=Streptomyces niveus TaxID=193462 RepID=UPI003448664A